MTTETHFTFVTDVSVYTPASVKEQLVKAVNYAHIGDKPVNIYDEETNRFVPNPDVTITEEHKSATWHAWICHRVSLKVSVNCKTGQFSFEVSK